MIFSTVTFLFYFLPLFLLLYFITPYKNTVLLIASLFFYAWGEAHYVVLMLFSISINFIFGLLINKYGNIQSKQRLFLSIGVGANLLLLGYFKYFNFITNDLLNTKLAEPVHLPLGISFFTFQAISYLVDVYRKEAKVEKNIFNLALYISMFPQLIAGPIVRFKTVAKQIHKRQHTLDNISQGMRIFIIGLAQKALIANTVAISADEIFALPESALTTAVAWLGAFCYSFQIYFDFAGYSNMAIGLGLIMGFTFPKNFNYPYVSQSITEFWRRWHISLSTWFRDYLYIPLGGNRLSPIRTYINLMVVFLLCGFWHGAAWTFIIWGGYHGLFLMLERFKLSQILNKLPSVIRHIYTLIVVIFGWVIFRAENFNQLKYYSKTLLGFGKGTSVLETMPTFFSHLLATTLIFAVLFSLPIFNYLKTQFKTTISNQQSIKTFSFHAVFEVFYLSVFLLSIINIASGSYNPFIYFRF
jgi:alginate O-acetyltransferase complex protein AlgI